MPRYRARWHSLAGPLSFGFVIAQACATDPNDGAGNWAVAESFEAPRLADAGAAPGTEATGTFVAMSTNIRNPVDGGVRSWTSRFPRIAAMIEAHMPDVIGLQEVRSKPFEDLRAAFPEYWWHWYQYGNRNRLTIFVNPHVFQVIDYGGRIVTTDQRDTPCGDVDEDPQARAIQWVKVRDWATGRERYFFNTHYPSKGSCERVGMAAVVADEIASRDDLQADVIAVGDFNDGFEPDGRVNASYERLLDRSGLIPTFELFNAVDASGEFATANREWSPTKRRGRMIDHVLTSSPAAEVQDAYIDHTLFSLEGEPVSCQTINDAGQCPGGELASSLNVYSDHWAVVTTFAR